MNYLAHAYLSFNNPKILVGNMISDYVKGKTKYDFSIGIQNGIQLHRAIDTFTDNHSIVKEAKVFFQPHYRLYSGAFIDVVFDHFLAKKLQQEINFKEFTTITYLTLENYFVFFPIAFQKVFTSMQQHDWLYNYQFMEGMQKSFKGLQHRAKYIEEVNTATLLFQNNYSTLELLFIEFWEKLLEFSKEEYNKLTNSF